MKKIIFLFLLLLIPYGVCTAIFSPSLISKGPWFVVGQGLLAILNGICFGFTTSQILLKKYKQSQKGKTNE